MNKTLSFTQDELFALSTIIEDYLFWHRKEDRDLAGNARTALDKIKASYFLPAPTVADAKNMKSLGSWPIWLKGSRRTIQRAVRQRDDGKCFIIYYDQLIGVHRHDYEYITDEEY